MGIHGIYGIHGYTGYTGIHGIHGNAGYTWVYREINSLLLLHEGDLSMKE